MDDLRTRENQVIFFTSRESGKVVLLAGVSKNLTSKYKAGDLVKKAAELCDGAGGGRPDFAQAGGKNAERLSEIRPLLFKLLTV